MESPDTDHWLSKWEQESLPYTCAPLLPCSSLGCVITLSVGNIQLHPHISQSRDGPTLIVQQRDFTVVQVQVRCYDANIMFPSHLLESPGSHLSRQTRGLFILPSLVITRKLDFGKYFTSGVKNILYFWYKLT